MTQFRGPVQTLRATVGYGYDVSRQTLEGLKSFEHDTTIHFLTTGHDKLIATNDGEDALQSEVILNKTL